MFVIRFVIDTSTLFGNIVEEWFVVGLEINGGEGNSNGVCKTWEHWFGCI